MGTEPSSNLIRIKQFGLQRSGTNYTKFLLEAHYFVWVDVNQGGWKHGRCDEQTQQTHVVFTTKNVYSWLDSIYRYFHSGIDKDKRLGYGDRFSEFLRSRYKIPREHVDQPNPIVQWNELNKHWQTLQIPECQVAHIRYEDLIQTPQDSIEAIAHQLSLHRRLCGFRTPSCRMAIGHERTNETNKPFSTQYYLEHQYLRQFSEEDLCWINHCVDEELVANLGYQLQTETSDQLAISKSEGAIS